MSTSTTKFPDCVDHWLAEDGPAAIVLREYLLPVEGKDSPVFPPTFAASETADDNEEETKAAYNINRLPGDGNRSVCLIDSVGSQANRLEPLFKEDKYKGLVPQVTIKINDHRSVNLLDAGHRAGDAVVRFSTLQPRLLEAFRSIVESGDSEALAKIAPTSVLFGVWDSRGTQAKLPRLLSSVVRAFDVDELTRSATYRSAIDYVNEGVVKEELDTGQGKKNPLSRDGMKYALATGTPGGVLVRTCIRRDATLSLAGIRCLKAGNDDRTTALRRYILGLGLCALTAPPKYELRQGCHLTRDPGVKPNPNSEVVAHTGERWPFVADDKAVLEFARTAASPFVDGAIGLVDFDPEHADLWLRLDKKEQKALTRAGSVSKEAIKDFLKRKKLKRGGKGNAEGDAVETGNAQ
jgi:CRISPR-associated protein Csb1